MRPNPEASTLVGSVESTDHILGAEAARLVVVEYADFQCPNCAQAYPAVKILLKHFENRVRFVFRHFPLMEVHPLAAQVAQAAEAAGAQGRFWPMHDLLFEHQSHLEQKDLHHYAEQLELDLNRFDYELSDEVYRQRVQEHIAGGRRSGVRATPTFFVDGRVQDVSFRLQALFDAVEARLLQGSDPSYSAEQQRAN